MCRPGVTVNAAVLAPAIGIEARLETDIGAIVPSDDRFGSITKILCRAPRLFRCGNINIDRINVGQIDVQLFEPIRRAPGRATPSKGCVALRRFEDHRFKLFVRRHVISSHEHITLSSKFLSSCYTFAPTTEHQFSGGVAERLIAPVLKFDSKILA